MLAALFFMLERDEKKAVEAPHNVLRKFKVWLFLSPGKGV